MQIKLLILCFLILVVLISGCTQQTPKSIKEANVCGDNICGATEDCNNCPQDCGCKSGEYCSSTGVCRADVCGDSICSSNENKTQSCCEDCGCPSNKLCNKVTQACQDKLTISEDNVRKVANDYMTNNNITGNITNIIDTYYKNETVKQVNIDCRTVAVPYPCQIILYVNNTGDIVEEIKSS